ncbi:MAG: radical SAM-associated putative lipoprotein [Bacteroidales bacterium]|nr:radical SAM-associated putative lipoprotein [Bacteroidales bacterium]
MKARIRHFYEIIAGAVLSLLGFTGCDPLNVIINSRVEYGMPHATFKVTGTVKAEDTGNPVQGIKVKFRQHVDGSEDENGNPFYTEVEFSSDEDGKVEGSFVEWPDDKNIEFTFEDIDGEENGGYFAPDTLRGKDIKIEFEEAKKSTWYKGTYNISFEEKLKKSAD